MSPRFPFEYTGMGIDALLERLSLLRDALDMGSQTRVGVAAGIAHDFSAMSPEQLKTRIHRVLLALHLSWLDIHPDEDPATNPYPDPGVAQVMNVHVIFE